MSELACMSGLDLLVDYLEGQLPLAMVSAIERHVAGCRRCQAFLESYQATPRIVREATDAALPAGLQSSLMAWLEKQRRST